MRRLHRDDIRAVQPVTVPDGRLLLAVESVGARTRLVDARTGEPAGSRSSRMGPRARFGQDEAVGVRGRRGGGWRRGRAAAVSFSITG
jgi:hypothetical protein